MNIKNRQKLIPILVVLVLLLITFGVSVSFFSYARNGITENSVKLGSITFKYTENDTLGNGISITDAFPLTDEEGKSVTGEGKVFDFKIESTLSRSDLEYEVVAEPTEESTLPLDAIKFYLTDITSGTEVGIDSTINSDGSVKTLAEFSDTLIKNAQGKTIYQETILKNTKGYIKQFRARMWIADDIDWSDDDYIGKSGAIRINVYANSNRDMASTDVTTPVDTSLERVTANNMYLFTETTIEEYQYTLTVPNEVEKLDIDAIPRNMDATVEITKINDITAFIPSMGSSLVRRMNFTEELELLTDFTLDVGENFFKAVVTSSDKSKKQEYILQVIREESGNTNLNSLEVVGYELVPSYSNSNNLYEVIVPYSATSVTIKAETYESTQKISGTGEKQLDVGVNEFEIIVTAANGETRTIKITIVRNSSADASIANVGVKGYTLSQLEDNIYYVTISNYETSAEIINISTTGATVNGIGVKENLTFGKNDFEIEVISGDGTVRNTFIIRITKEKDTDNTLKSLNLTNCTLSPSFDSNTTDYTCTVENKITKTTVTAEANSGVATITGLGDKNLIVGDNVIDVVVKAQNDSIKTYEVLVVRKPNSDSSLKSLGITNQILSPDFDKEKLNYTLTVPYSVDTITITGEASSDVSIVTGLGNKTLNVGSNTFEVMVEAEDKLTVSTYVITVTRLEDSDTSLKSIGVEDYSIVKVDDNHYTLTVDNEIERVVVTAEATSSNSIVSGIGAKTLVVGENSFDIQVTAKSGAISIYEIVITRLASSDATLKSLTVSDGTLSPTFASGTTSYTLSVPYSVTSLTVTPTVNNSEASYKVTENTTLIVGTNKVEVVVTAGDGTKKTYTITVTRNKDTTDTLKSLSLTSCTLSPSFAGETTSYTCTVENTVTSTSVSAEATSSVASVSGVGSKALSVGTNTVEVKVTAQSGATKTYTVKVTRKASSDATLKSLSLSSGTLSPAFASGTTSYTATVPYSTTSITINATVNNSEATYTVSGNTSLVVGTNTVEVVVTSGDGTTKTYTIKVTRSKDSTATLKSLAITGYSLSPTFASGTTSYTATVEASSIEITAAATSTVAIVTGTGTKKLNWGSNTVSVIVTAQDGTTKTYVITINNIQPTAPTITGGSTAWTTNNMTVKVLTESTALSGIAYYQYCVSPTVAISDNSCWVKGSSVTVTTEGTRYIYFRAVSNSNNVSNITDYQLIRIDRNLPTISYSIAGGTYSVNQKITLTANDANFAYMDIEIYNGTTLMYQSTISNPTTSYTATFNSVGNWTVYTRAFDYKGNKQSQSPENENGWYYQSYTIK